MAYMDICDRMREAQWKSLVVLHHNDERCQVVGGAVFQEHPNFIELFLLAIDSQFQTFGLGSRLLCKLKEYDQTNCRK